MKKSFAVLTMALVVALGINSCKKDSVTTTIPPSGHPQIRSNVIIVDSNYWRLRSNLNQLNNQGLLEFSFNANTPKVVVNVGDIVIGLELGGYIRKVFAVELTNYDMILHTKQANLSDVFNSGTISWKADLNNTNPVGGTNGFSYSFSNKKIYENADAEVRITSGHIDMNPEFTFTCGFDSLGINSFEMKSNNFNFNQDFAFNVLAPNWLSMQNEEFSLATFSKKFVQTFPVGDVRIPVGVVVDVELIAHTSALINASQGASGKFTNVDNMSLGVRYTSGHWEDIFSSSATKTIHLDSVNGGQNVSVTMSITPKVSVKIYGEEIVNLTAGLKESFLKKQNLNTLDWNLSAYEVVTAAADVVGTKILGNNIALFSQDRVGDSLKLTTPTLAEINAGDGQVGPIGLALPSPVKVKVTGSDGSGQGGVIVHFLTNSGGSVTPANAVTDKDGYAQATWKLSTTVGTQSLTAKVMNSTGQYISGAPLSFTATGQ